MDKKTKSQIIAKLREICRNYHQPRKEAFNAAKVAPATFICKHCNIWIYTGAKTHEKVAESLSEPFVKGKAYADHIEPVVPISGFSRGDWDWDEYVLRMFCLSEGFQILCKPCHDSKTYLERQLKKENKLKK